MHKKTICVITDHYPSHKDNTYVFVQKAVDGFLSSGLNVIVFSPICIVSNMKNKRGYRKIKEIRENKNREKYIVYSPIIDVSLFYKFHKKIDYISKAIINRIMKDNIKFDYIYAHFFNRAGFIAADIASFTNKPYFVASGESDLSLTLRNIDQQYIRKKFINLRGIITVSTQLKKEITEMAISDAEILVIPNGIDKNIFFYSENIRKKKRKEMELSNQDYVIIFVGYFIDRKGPLRLIEAVESLNNVKLVFVGSGEQKLESEKIIFKGSLSQEHLNDYLNAADLFVLPTKAEGNCNAILEALNVKLNVVSSSLPFNEELREFNNVKLINPNMPSQIRDAIKEFMSDSKINRFQNKTEGIISIEDRMIRIHEFIRNKSVN